VGGFAIPRFEARVASAAGEEDVVLAVVATGYVPEETPEWTRSDQRRFDVLKSRVREALS
jgi:hypothetical protein